MVTIIETQTSLALEASRPNLTSIPVLDFNLTTSPTTKPRFLGQLREALVIIGFFYLKNPPLPTCVKQEFVQKSMALCNQPLEKKMEIAMVNSKHFLGYSGMGLERTAMRMDHREMFDFLTPMPPPKPEDPVWMNVQGPNQWPDENVVPGFRVALENYLAAISNLGNIMKSLVAEALDLAPDALDKFFHDPPRNKVSLLKYPPPPPPSHTTTSVPVQQNSSSSRRLHSSNSNTGDDEEKETFQGVGAHKDGGFLTYLLQATSHPGLEAQSKTGIWVPVPPLPNTLVVNVGRSLEAMTGGVCTATTHRVRLGPNDFVDPRTGRARGPRFSYPVFQTLKLDLTRDDLCSLRLPPAVRALVRDGDRAKSDAEAFFAQYHLMSPGQGIFTARLTSHPDVGRRWYPELLEAALKGQEDFRS
ncbi:putative oxidoreductase [Nemania sp. FL0916]|nr:putative oxidoreductase [Nemania sp. FL0916]